MSVFQIFYLLLFMFHNFQIYLKIFFKPQCTHISLDKNRPLTIWGPAMPLGTYKPRITEKPLSLPRHARIIAANFLKCVQMFTSKCLHLKSCVVLTSSHLAMLYCMSKYSSFHKIMRDYVSTVPPRTNVHRTKITVRTPGPGAQAASPTIHRHQYSSAYGYKTMNT